MKSKQILLLLSILIIVPLIVLGCNTQDTAELKERIEELEEQLAQKETAAVQEETIETEQEEATMVEETIQAETTATEPEEQTIDSEEIDTTFKLTEVPRVEAEGGYIEKDSYVGNGEHIYAGDTERDNMCKGFVSFDITGFKEAEVGEAVLTFVNKQVLNDPSDFGDLIIASHWYGDNPLVMIDYESTGTKIQSSNSPDFICSNDTLKSELQKAIDELNEDMTRFQVLVYFTSDSSNGNGITDGWEYNQEDIVLEIGIVE